MAFSDEINAFAAKVKRRQQALLVGTVELLHTSIKDGHALTGAPGQPIDISTLYNSWQVTFPGANTAQTATNLVYAKPIEDGIGKFGPLTLRSKVGGFHSVKLTRAAWPKVVEHVTRGLT